MLPVPRRIRYRNRVSLLKLFGSAIALLLLGFLVRAAVRCRWCCTGTPSNSHLLPRDKHAAGKALERLAVLIPYRDRPDHLRRMLPITTACLQRSRADFSIFVIEQAPGLHFNRGALLNVGALLLEGSGYDCFVFHDVDTVCSGGESVTYRCPAGAAPLHLTPQGLHPRDDYPEFLGGNIVFTPQQFRRVNGFQHAFWGWGKEDNNMVRRLQLHGMWPPERPAVRAMPDKDHYWVHLDHTREQAVKLKQHAARNGAGLANLEPRVHDDNRLGLRQTRFRVERIEPVAGSNATRFLVQLACDRTLTPWCDPTYRH